jgi:hypothetical protein
MSSKSCHNDLGCNRSRSCEKASCWICPAEEKRQAWLKKLLPPNRGSRLVIDVWRPSGFFRVELYTSVTGRSFPIRFAECTPTFLRRLEPFRCSEANRHECNPSDGVKQRTSLSVWLQYGSSMTAETGFHRLPTAVQN